MTVKNWKLKRDGNEEGNPVKESYFYIRVTESNANAYVDETSREHCQVSFDPADDIKTIEYNGEETNASYSVDGLTNAAGFYNLYFRNCAPDTSVYFDLELDEYNIDSRGGISYLPIGELPLPTIYSVFAGIFLLLTVVWVLYLRGEGKRVNKVHHLCSAYLLVLTISLVMEAMEKHYIKVSGSPKGWDIAYYVFASLQASFFIILIALFGTGWTFIKPFLSDKDKTIFMIVIPLQVLDNIALVMVDEGAPGAQTTISWSHIFTIVDIICCGAIIVPIIWSIKHLKDASQTDEKAALNLQKLKLFRQFYLFVLTYIYVTRIIITLLKSSLPYRYIWLGEFFTLLASLIFYTATGYQFRPSLDNEYFNVPLNDDGIDMLERGSDVSINRDQDD
eukprot:gene6524-7554_t